MNISKYVAKLTEKAMAPHSSTLAWRIPWTGGAWCAVVHVVVKSQTRLSDFPFTFHFHELEKEMATHSSVLVFPMETPLSVKLCTEHGDTESDSLCAALKLSFKQQLENPYNALPYP